MSLMDELNHHGLPKWPVKLNKPLWKGPEIDGVTYSLLSRFLACRERFRLYVVEGLSSLDQFSHRIHYGNMWHLCEEVYAKYEVGGPPRWALSLYKDLKCYWQLLSARYPTQQEQILHWYNVCKVQFPIYVDYWSKHAGTVERKPLLQEQVFDVPYKLPSGRTVRLRGKWDSVDLVGNGVWLQENKTKSDIDQQQIARQLRFDLQTMLYLVALYEERKTARWPIQADRKEVCGVRYNVVRRPLSGGRYTIVRHKPTKKDPLGETPEHFYERLAGSIRADPDYFFMRWNVEISAHDIAVFRRTCLDPILDGLYEWWTYINDCDPAPEEYGAGIHFRFPYGVYRPTLEGNPSDLDGYLETGNAVGLRRVENLFPELGE